MYSTRTLRKLVRALRNLVIQRLRKKAEYLQKLEDVFAAIDETGRLCAKYDSLRALCRDRGDGMITEKRLAKVFANPTAVAYFQRLTSKRSGVRSRPTRDSCGWGLC